MAIVHGIEVDMIPSGRFAELWLNQYDDDFRIEVTLYASRGDFSIQPDTTAAIRGLKPDGNGYSADAAVDVSRGVVTIAGDQQITAAPGRSLYELTLYKDGKELNSANFYLIVEPCALDKDAPPSDSKLREFTQVWDRADEIIEAGERHDEAARVMRENAEAAAASEAAAKASEEAAAETLERVNEKAEQIQRVTFTSDQLAQEALDMSTATHNELLLSQADWEELRSLLNEMNATLPNKVDGAYATPDGYLVLTSNGEPVTEPLGPFAGGGGGGGGSMNGAVMRSVNRTAWGNTLTISEGDAARIAVEWESVENDLPTGNGTMKITVNSAEKASLSVSQGLVELDLKEYLTAGSNSVRVDLYDVYENHRRMMFTVTVVSLSLESSFDTGRTYSGPIRFPFVPKGGTRLEKTVHFILDGEELETMSTYVSNSQQFYTIPAQNNGSHTLQVYFEALINSQMVRSNELFFDFRVYDAAGSTDPIITSDFKQTTAAQYSTLVLKYRVFDPMNQAAAQVKIYVNTGAADELVSDITVDQSEQSFSYRADVVGPLTIKLKSGATEKSFRVDITKSMVDAAAVEAGLALHLNAIGRSNSEADPDIWRSGDISAVLTGFNHVSDGWVLDSEGLPVLRLAGDARATIPYQIFAEDFRTTGKTIEIEFATRNVLDYDAELISCMSGGRGLLITAQKALLKSEQSEISVQYKEDEHIRLSFVVGKRGEDRLVLMYLNGIASGVIQYPAGDDFSQPSPVGISLGNSDCTLDIYRIRVYDQDLNRQQILDNWIADTLNIDEMVARWQRNQVFDPTTRLVTKEQVVAATAGSLPYMILTTTGGNLLPQYKGDERRISVEYVDPASPSLSFTADGVVANVQGTSSAPYARKNYDLKFKGSNWKQEGKDITKYSLRGTNIPFNRFVLKADVASSESVNNTGLTGLYNDTCPYKTPEMMEDPRVRHGIDGFPIVVFWQDKKNDSIYFLGKYNFNHPKRAADVYGYSGEMESWEWQNNTSDRMLFKSDDFESTVVNIETGEEEPAWTRDFEARFPDDTWGKNDPRELAKLREFISWVVSTDRTQATGDPLESAVTYGGTSYSSDTAEYRLAKFRAELGDRVEIDSAIFYYLFTELFLMMDSRAKNMFIGFKGGPVTIEGSAMDRKAVLEPYDMDTALGTNNEGVLAFGYSLEDTDHLEGGADVFNGQNSVFWCNLRDSFKSEIVEMYKTRLRVADSGSYLSYETVEQIYEERQAKWPEAIWNEDAWFKYIDPLVAPETGKEPTDFYLPMLQGSKEEQRKWWLYNRFRYMDSKFNAADAFSDEIQLRAYKNPNPGAETSTEDKEIRVTLTPFTDIYTVIKFGSTEVIERAKAKTPVTLVSSFGNLNDTEVYIKSAAQLASVGDLSSLYVGYADFSKATRLQQVKLGGASPYVNGQLERVSFLNNPLLRSLDVRNCTALGKGAMKTVDLRSCVSLEEALFDGTAVAGVDLPDGGVVKTLHLPETVSNLTILNQKGITDFTMPGYGNVTTLRLENVADTVPARAILDAMAAGGRVRLVGFRWNMATVAEVNSLLDKLDTMRGLDIGGNNLTKPYLSGTIYIEAAEVSGEDIAAIQARISAWNTGCSVTVLAGAVTSKIYYYNYDGSTLLHTETLTHLNGVISDGSYDGQPTRAEDELATYTFVGWSRRQDSSAADEDAQKGSFADKTLYAAYTRVVKTYTVYFYDGETLMQTVENVPAGSSAEYTGEDLSGPGAKAIFDSWNPAPTNVTSNLSCYAQYRPEVKEIEDSWEEIIAAINDGTYRQKYKIGNYKPLDLGAEGIVDIQIAEMDADALADGGNAPLTFIAKNTLLTSQSIDGNSKEYFVQTDLNNYLENTIKGLIPDPVRNAIKEVTKSYSHIYGDQVLRPSIWIPSRREVGGAIPRESSGVIYGTLFFNNASRRTTKVGADPTNYNDWWLRSLGQKSPYVTYYYVSGYGEISGFTPSAAKGVRIGFCLGKTTE